MNASEHHIRLQGPWRIWLEASPRTTHEVDPIPAPPSTSPTSQSSKPQRTASERMVRFDRTLPVSPLLAAWRESLIESGATSSGRFRLIFQRSFNWPNLQRLRTGQERLYLVGEVVPDGLTVWLNNQRCLASSETSEFDLAAAVELTNLLTLALPVDLVELSQSEQNEPAIGPFALVARG